MYYKTFTKALNCGALFGMIFRLK